MGVMASKIVFESPRFVLSNGPTQRPAPDRPVGESQPPLRSPLPVVVGCPRSGTSLLAVMLDSHPQLAVPPETSFLGAVASIPAAAPDARLEFFKLVTADRIPISNWSDFGLDGETLWRRLLALEPFTVAAGLRAFYALYAEAQGKPRYGEKTPGYVFLLPEIAALLPEAHFIHVIRDPGDTALSWRKTWFAPSLDLRVLGEEWRKHVEAGRRAQNLVPHYVELRFEDLVRDPERELKSLCQYLSLAWDPLMLDYRAQGAARLSRLQGRLHARGAMIAREERTRIHANLTRAPDTDRLDVWRREMTPAERRLLEDAAGPLVQALGYAA
jgi:hypothetical protein